LRTILPLPPSALGVSNVILSYPRESQAHTDDPDRRPRSGNRRTMAAI
jgi:hypothetical protein